MSAFRSTTVRRRSSTCSRRWTRLELLELPRQLARGRQRQPELLRELADRALPLGADLGEHRDVPAREPAVAVDDGQQVVARAAPLPEPAHHAAQAAAQLVQLVVLLTIHISYHLSNYYRDDTKGGERIHVWRTSPPSVASAVAARLSEPRAARRAADRATGSISRASCERAGPARAARRRGRRRPSRSPRSSPEASLLRRRHVVALGVLDHRSLHREPRRELGDRGSHHRGPVVPRREARDDLCRRAGRTARPRRPRPIVPAIAQPYAGS